MLLVQLLVLGLAQGCLYAIVAVSYATIYNTTRIFHIAHGAVYTTGAYLSYFFIVSYTMPPMFAVCLAVLLTGVLGLLIELLLYAPLERRGASSLICLLASLGCYVAIVNTIALFFGNETLVLRAQSGKPVPVGPVLLTRIQILHIATALVLLPAFVLLLKKTRIGRIIRAVRDDPSLASIMGVNIARVRLVVFTCGSALAATAASLAGLDIGIDPHVGMKALLTAAVAVIIGGIGTFEGPILGAFVLASLQSVVIWATSARWTDTVTFGLLVIFLLFRPSGILGHPRRLEEAMQ